MHSNMQIYICTSNWTEFSPMDKNIALQNKRIVCFHTSFFEFVRKIYISCRFRIDITNTGIHVDNEIVRILNDHSSIFSQQDN